MNIYIWSSWGIFPECWFPIPKVSLILSQQNKAKQKLDLCIQDVMSPQLALRPEFLPVYLTPQWYQIIAFPGFPWQKLYASQVPQEHCISSLNPEYFIFLYLYSSAITACSSALFSLKAPFQRAGFHMGWLRPRARAAAGSSTPAGSPLLRLPPGCPVPLFLL